MKIALVYDRVNKWGGAERVLLALHKIFPDAPLYTSLYNPKTASWARDFNVKTSFLQRFPMVRAHHELLAFLMPVIFEQFNFDEYDLVISVTSEAAKGIITKPGTKHICYCLTPTRYLWSGYEEYFRNAVFKFASFPLVSYLRRWDLAASKRPDVLIALSKEVQGRIRKYYGRDAGLVYPAVTLPNFEAKMVSRGGRGVKTRKDDFFLVVSRLSKFTEYKRVDLAIAACNELKLQLKIIGTGNWEGELKNMAGETIEFLGSVTDAKLAEYYKNCRALIFPGIEDFGLTIVEAQKFGSPVIAFRGGGALETVIEGRTGIFFEEQKVSSLVKAMRDFEKYDFKRSDCMMQANKFNFDNFKKEILSLVERTI